jgi:hypothetical protein
MKKYKCYCADCQELREKYISEYDLHIFVGTNKANHKINLSDFEESLNFDNVIHWNVGFSDKARYFVYRDKNFNSIAWYDVEICEGFK